MGCQGPKRLSCELVLFCLLISLLTNLALSKERCNPNDKKALLKIKAHFGNPSSMANWSTSTDCCSQWQGEVGCDENGRVINFGILIDASVRGQLPSALGDLTALRSLTLDDVPNLWGPFPKSMAKLTNLFSITIYNTNMSGTIPSYIGQFTSLNTISLAGNKFSGVIPSTFSQLINLEILELMGHNLYGPLPEIVFKGMRKLVTISLDDNNFTGPIPESIGLLPELQELYLASNQLTGPIPKSLGRSKAITIDLSGNRIDGDASSLFQSDNTAINDIELQFNRLKFDFSKIKVPQSLRVLNIGHNMIYGSLPEGLAKLVDLEVENNQLCGQIPGGLAKFGPAIFRHNKCLCGRPLPRCK